MLKINIPPAEIFKINDKYRTDDAQGDLWTLDQIPKVEHEIVGKFTICAPDSWPTKCFKSYSIAEFKQNFGKHFEVGLKLGPMNNVVIAGGSVLWSLDMIGSKPDDIDLFIYGVDPTDMNNLWDVVNKISDKLVKVAYRLKYTHIKRIAHPKVISFTLTRNEEVTTVQIILRAYKSISSILHAFDVPASCVAFDWNEVYVTTLSAYALVYKINLVNFNYSSLSFDYRLAKYFSRGYALGLQLHPSTCIILGVNYRSWGNIFRKYCNVYYVDMSCSKPVSDYFILSPKNLLKKSTYDAQWVAFMNNILRPHRTILIEEIFIKYGNEKFYKFIDKFKLPYSNSDLNKMISTLLLKINDDLSYYRQNGLSKYKLYKLYPFAYLIEWKNIHTAMEAFIERYTGEINAEWWYVTDPGRQYTASFNPIYIDPKNLSGFDENAFTNTEIVKLIF